ncbi:RNA-directed DNA polymerase, eukaryota [Tanacetum coccineum]
MKFGTTRAKIEIRERKNIDNREGVHAKEKLEKTKAGEMAYGAWRDNRSYQEVLKTPLKHASKKGNQNKVTKMDDHTQQSRMSEAMKDEGISNSNNTQEYVELVLDENRSKYLSKCVIGQVKEVACLDRVTSRLEAEGLEVEEVKLLGGLELLIKFRTEKMAVNLISNVEAGQYQWLSKVHRWLSGYYPVFRSVWLNIFGVPVEGWFESTFKRVASKWGRVLETSNCNLEEADILVTGKVLVQTRSGDTINERRFLKINGLVFPKQIKEDRYTLFAVGTGNNTHDVSSDSDIHLLHNEDQDNESERDESDRYDGSEEDDEDEKVVGDSFKHTATSNKEVNLDEAAMDETASTVPGQTLGINGGKSYGVDNNGPDSMDNILGQEKVVMTNGGFGLEVCNSTVIEKNTIADADTSNNMEKEDKTLEEVNINLAQPPNTYHEMKKYKKSHQSAKIEGEANEKRKSAEKRRQSQVSNCKSTLSGKLSMRITKNKRKNKGKIYSSCSSDRKVASEVKINIGTKNEKKKKIDNTFSGVSSSSLSVSTDDSNRIREIGQKSGFVWPEEEEGVPDKVDWVKELGVRENSIVFGLQETKLKEVDENFVRRLWNGDDLGFAQVDANGGSGGLITMWNALVFTGTHAVGEIDFLAVVGKWNGVEGDVGLLNVYGPRDEYQRGRLWNPLSSILTSVDAVWCLFGDFNEVRCIEDKLNSEFNERSARSYNDFIRMEQLVDIPMGGKRYTRISDDGIKFSKLDMFLVSGGFQVRWPELSVVALDRKLSDHCPIMLMDKVMNFGPKPFCVFDIWFKERDAEDVVVRGWNKPVAVSIPDRIFKDKLKNVKQELKK